jgi:RHS repeat-associated protein
MGYVYDDGDNVIETTYPSGRVVTYQRDGVRRVEAIDTTVNGVAQNIVRNIRYRGDNQVIACTFGNGLTDTREYDLQGRLFHQLLKDELDNTIDERTYTHDKNSNILSIDTNVEDNAYLYDKLDRLTSDTVDASPAVDYSYDLNDNRLAGALADSSRDDVYLYSDGSNQLASQERLLPAGPVIDGLPERELVYNDAGRLYQLIEDGVLKAEYVYNDEGQRTRKVVHGPGGSTTLTVYHYDSMGYLITETDETGALIKDYIWTEGMHPVAQIDNTLGVEAVLYLYTDHLMTNRLATDEVQSVVWRWEGEAFGNTEAEELGGFEVHLRFPGQYFDTETNLHYNHFRYYDPQLGRYITSDPIGLNVGTNSYVYGRANSLGMIDILGLTASCPGSPPKGDPDWVPYAGDSTAYHCGFDGYLEKRRPCDFDRSATAECFYDRSGNLVDDAHKYKGCRGTPDHYPVFPGDWKDPKRWEDIRKHMTEDPGGPSGPSATHEDLGAEGRSESERYRRDRSRERGHPRTNPSKNR